MKRVIAIICLCLSLIGFFLFVTEPDNTEPAVPAVMFFIVAIVILATGKRKKMSKATGYINPYADVKPFEEDRGWPIVSYSGINLDPQEMIIYAIPAQMSEEKEQIVGYAGGSTGYSVRVAKGLTLRKGKSQGKAIRQNVQNLYSGDYVITNQRIMFIGNKKSFEIPIDKITAAKPIANNAITVIAKNKNYSIIVDRDHTKHTLGFTWTAMKGIEKSDAIPFIV